ncbi:helix-turn-helix domain-containing protein [Xenorhabdus bovienii]|uniref:helix-turn-helix domain-containing protein n=1 Tax=Xenorhabdus bovienii TaxID=40576 RepID=UPI0023B2F1EE|nr:LysR family transcriptional regulator [Xenorhabdus bovienii]
MAKEKSFTKASKKMSISRSSVVANIKNLEERYNIIFINRNTRYFSLTEEGKYIFEQSAKIEKILCETMGYLGDSAINLKKNNWNKNSWHFRYF